MRRLNFAKQWALGLEVRRSGSLLSDLPAFVAKCEDYFAWCDKNPWEKTELVKYQGGYSEADVPLGRPYSVDGLCIYLGVSTSYFRAIKAQLKERIADGRATEDDLDQLTTVELLETHIRTQQLEGAIVEVFNPGIIARLNALAENTVNNNTGETVLRVSVRDNETADNLKLLDNLL